MSKAMAIWGIAFWVLVGCGPQTIFVRPELDTPAQHVSNGYKLLEQEKWDDARREFERARDLDPDCTDAVVGLALAAGGQGNTNMGFHLLEEARPMARTLDEHISIQKALERLRRMGGAP